MGWSLDLSRPKYDREFTSYTNWCLLKLNVHLWQRYTHSEVVVSRGVARVLRVQTLRGDKCMWSSRGTVEAGKTRLVGSWETRERGAKA